MQAGIVRCVGLCLMLASGGSIMAAENEDARAAAASSPRAALPPSLPVKRDAITAPGPASWNPGLALLGVAGAAGGFWLWRRGFTDLARARVRNRTGTSAVVRLSSQPLTPHASVHAVQWKGEEYLIACTAQQVTLLSHQPAPRGSGAEP
jgi:hypothetical protein